LIFWTAISVTTEITDNNGATAGWLFFDGECPLCCASAHRVERLLARRRFQLCALQSPEAPHRLGLSGPVLLREMHLLLADGRVFGGADAVVEIARRIWWAWPLWLVSRLPGAKPLLRAGYRVIAANRHCIGGVCRIPGRSSRPRDRFNGGTGKTPGQTESCKPHPRHQAFFELP